MRYVLRMIFRRFQLVACLVCTVARERFELFVCFWSVEDTRYSFFHYLMSLLFPVLVVLELVWYAMGDRLGRITEYLVVVRGGDLASEKTSTLTGLLKDEKDTRVLECFQKHGWNGKEFVSMPDFPVLDEALSIIGNIPPSSENFACNCVIFQLACLNTDVEFV